jgi:hypothetical protein
VPTSGGGAGPFNGPVHRQSGPATVSSVAAKVVPNTRLAVRTLTPLRYVMVVGGIGFAVLAAGYALNLGWATRTWPWPDSNLSHLFVGSFLAGAGAVSLWIGAVGEWGALLPAFSDLLVISAGLSIYLFSRVALGDGSVSFAVFFTAAAVGSAFVVVWSRNVAIRDARMMPRALRWWFVLFAALTTIGGAGLLLRDQLFPWVLDERTGVMIAFIFLGATVYFLLALLNPSWNNARGQLVGFLVYDLVLIPRYVSLLGRSGPAGYPSTINGVHLGVYLAALALSAVVATYYLFVCPGTRSWAVQHNQ